MLALSSLAHLVSILVFVFFGTDLTCTKWKRQEATLKLGAAKGIMWVEFVRKNFFPIIYPVHRPPYHLCVDNLAMLASSINVCSSRSIWPLPSVIMYAPSTFVSICGLVDNVSMLPLSTHVRTTFFLIFHPIHRPPYHLPVYHLKMLASSIQDSPWTKDDPAC